MRGWSYTTVFVPSSSPHERALAHAHIHTEVNRKTRQACLTSVLFCLLPARLGRELQAGTRARELKCPPELPAARLHEQFLWNKQRENEASDAWLLTDYPQNTSCAWSWQVPDLQFNEKMFPAESAAMLPPLPYLVLPRTARGRMLLSLQQHEEIDRCPDRCWPRPTALNSGIRRGSKHCCWSNRSDGNGPVYELERQHTG